MIGMKLIWSLWMKLIWFELMGIPVVRLQYSNKNKKTRLISKIGMPCLCECDSCAVGLVDV